MDNTTPNKLKFFSKRETDTFMTNKYFYLFRMTCFIALIATFPKPIMIQLFSQKNLLFKSGKQKSCELISNEINCDIKDEY